MTDTGDAATSEDRLQQEVGVDTDDPPDTEPDEKNEAEQGMAEAPPD